MLEYPSDAAPLLEVEAPHLPFDAEAEIHSKAEEMLTESPGNVMMFELIEWSVLPTIFAVHERCYSMTITT